MFEYASMHNTCELHDMLRLKCNENTVQNRVGMYLSYTCHELLYTCHSLVYPDMQQLYFESIFPYLWGSLGCLDLIRVGVGTVTVTVIGPRTGPRGPGSAGERLDRDLAESEFDKSLFRQ